MVATIALITIPAMTSSIKTNTDVSATKSINSIKEGDIGLNKQPNGPFAVYYCSEYSQGNYIGIIYYDRIGGPQNNTKWGMSNRFWQDKEWGSDVNNFVWGLDGKYLYIATSNIYGEGGIFELDLYNKVARKIFPLNNLLNLSYTTEIIDVNFKAMTLKVRLTFENEIRIEQIDIKHT